MELEDLFDMRWNHREETRFLNDDTKISTSDFDPEAFKHEGFEDRETYLDKFVPALADDDRLKQELNNFTPPRLRSINDSPYQALVIRAGILRTLIKQQDYQMEKSALLNSVKSWQQDIIGSFEEGDFTDDNLLHLAKAAVDYKNDIDDSEMHMVHQYFRIRNQEMKWKHEHFTWLDLFERLSSIDRFPKVSRSERPSHAIDTIKQGMWSLQEQAIIYEIVDPEEGNLVGIPEDYVDFIREWLYYEMSDENYLRMMEELAVFDQQGTLIEARELFDIHTGTKGLNEKRRESIVDKGVFPSDLFREAINKSELKGIVDRYGLDAHKQKSDQMIEAIIEYFEQSQSVVDDGEPTVELFLKCYDDIADGNVDRVPPQIQGIVEDGSQSEKIEILFEQATAEIFEETFNLDGTNLLGQTSSGTVADGEIKQDNQWLLWDNKRRSGPFKLGANTRSTIKSYIDRKSQQHEVNWFLLIAPKFSDSAEDNAQKLEIETGVDIRLVEATDFQRLANLWEGRYAASDRELPLSVFKGAGELNIDIVEDILETQFA